MSEPQAKKLKSSHSSGDSTPTTFYTPTSSSRLYTVSLAVPSSILSNDYSHEYQTLLVGSIARAAAASCVDEIVVFNDNGDENTHFTEMMVHILSYLETAPYLRKHLFKKHQNLKSIGVLGPIDLPNHYHPGEGGLYREGVVVGETIGGSLVDAGLDRKVLVEAKIPAGARLTLRFPSIEEGAGKGSAGLEYIPAEPVAPDAPRVEDGFYWGYTVRQAANLSAVFTEAPFEGGYNVSLGTSQHGTDIAGVCTKLPKFEHMLIAFGGKTGLEGALENDEALKGAGLEHVKDMFDFWVNACPGQGVRTIRTEDAVWLTLSRLRETIERCGVKA
ncbi:putative RNA methyltransferase [Pyronema domesticum]|uniref:Similar to Uncharacterized protein C9orf114 homolog acc. no. Q3UHX9 n=1 Tax=Pyronema omphalodes (strain CBS 100304) TaxID=1076935 RepID=U4KVJ7_PYROM|nr:putative RNA methyltransferase [Pyronema domesticum]CCX04946.1 Similar to Uncharacterized protein C9orf114 homolog; acc. no. Q3UHX9 [Pyronema omphalodes CBS 100304]